MPRQGGFSITIGKFNSQVSVMAYSSELGERYFLRLAPSSDIATEIATEEQRQLTEKW